MASAPHTKCEENAKATSATCGVHPPATALIRKTLARAGVFSLRLIGHPGAGKTELVEATLKRLPAPRRVAVIVVNPASARDAKRLEHSCGHVAHVDAAIPTAVAVWRIVSQLKLDQLDMLLIETAGGLAPLQDLGQDATAAVFAVSGGDDKAAEYHTLLNAAAAVVVTKTDLLPLVRFESRVFRNDLRTLNETAEVFEVSATTGSGIPQWCTWIERMKAAKRKDPSPRDDAEFSTSNYLG